MRSILPLHLLAMVSAAIPCYHSDGSLAPSQYQPCNGNSIIGMCCGIGWGDTCRPDGLCLGTYEQVYRDSCTDPTWQSNRCLKLCLDEGGNFNDTPITLCSDSSYCCSANNITCCTAKQGVFVVNNDGVFTILPTPPTSTSLTSSSTAYSVSSSAFSTTPPASTSSITSSISFSTTSSSSSSPTSTPPTNPSDKLSNTALIFSIIGPIVGVVALILTIIFGINQWKHRGEDRPIAQQLSPYVVVEEWRALRGVIRI